MSVTKKRGLPAGVQKKHTRTCATRTNPDARCRCKGGYQVQAGPRGNRVTRTFATVDAAVAWKADIDQAKRAGRVSSEKAPTLRDAYARWGADVDAGVALARGRKPFKAGTLKDYRRSMEADILPVYGGTRLDRLGDDLPELVAGLQRRGLAPSSVRNALMPVRAIYRHALRMKWVSHNPTLGLEVPVGSGHRLRVISPAEIPPLLAALDERDRALWATAMYAGLRRGELMALRWSSVDLAGGMLHVDAEHGGYDQKTGSTQAPKSKAGARRVPITAALREELIAHRLRAGARPQGLVFARGSLAGHCRAGLERGPFNDSSTGQRAHKAWTKAGLPPVSLHECRHTFASLAIAAMAHRGVFNPKLLQQIMGHSSIQVTYDRYGHLFPGQEAEVGVMLDEMLAAGPALPAVADAWQRLRHALEDADEEDARPVVAEALYELGGWQEDHPEGSVLPCDGDRGAAQRHRAAPVQRITDPGEPR